MLVQGVTQVQLGRVFRRVHREDSASTGASMARLTYERAFLASLYRPGDARPHLPSVMTAAAQTPSPADRVEKLTPITHNEIWRLFTSAPGPDRCAHHETVTLVPSAPSLRPRQPVPAATVLPRATHNSSVHRPDLSCRSTSMHGRACRPQSPHALPSSTHPPRDKSARTQSSHRRRLWLDESLFKESSAKNSASRLSLVLWQSCLDRPRNRSRSRRPRFRRPISHAPVPLTAGTTERRSVNARVQVMKLPIETGTILFIFNRSQPAECRYLPLRAPEYPRAPAPGFSPIRGWAGPSFGL